MKHYRGSQCIFSCQQLLILELTLTDAYCYFEACSGKFFDLLCSSFPNEKTTFSELGVFACQTWVRIFSVPYLENLKFNNAADGH